jgi:hypothetical protein
VTSIVAFVPDLMDRSKVSAAAGDRVRFVASAGELSKTEADVVVVDLSRPGVLEALPSIKSRTIGFGSHVDTELLDAAKEAGCDEVLARSAFFSQLPELLA